MTTTVHGAVREGREASIEGINWGPGRATVQVTGTTSSAVAARAAMLWWNDEYEQSGLWKAKSFRARCVNMEGGVFDVEVELRPVGAELLDPNSPHYRGFESSVQEIQSETDFNGLTISVSHTFPETDKDYPGETRTQGASVQLRVPTTVYTRNLLAYTEYPEVYQAILGSVNAATWFGHPAGYVRCTSVRPVQCWRVAAGEGFVTKWMIQFTFEMCYKGWAEQVAYIDERTGRPPENLVQGTGMKAVQVSEYYDFNQLFDTSAMPTWDEIIQAELPLGLA